MIKVENLKKRFGSVQAVDGLTFEIQKGEVIGLLGPNGAGKSTTMRLLSGYISPDSGTISIDGQLVNEQSVDYLQNIGYMPENNPLYKDMLVSEVLNLSADLKHIPREERSKALNFAVNSVGIKDVYYRPISELSKGYRQRVGMAVALLHKPQILILDEPTEGLDPNQRTEIRSLIRKLSHDRTIIISSHVMQEIQAVCSRILIINKGKLVANGTAEELSRSAKDERILSVELKGKEIENSLQTLKGAKKIETEKREDVLKAKIVTDKEVDLRPEISKLIGKNNWIILNMSEESRTLEDVFHEITIQNN